MNKEEFICKFYSCDNEEQFLKDIYHNLNCLQQENKILKEKVNKLEILIETLKLGVTLNQEQEDLLDKILFGGDSNE